MSAQGTNCDPCLGKSLRANRIVQIPVLFRIFWIVKVVLLGCAAQEQQRQWQPVNFKTQMWMSGTELHRVNAALVNWFYWSG